MMCLQLSRLAAGLVSLPQGRRYSAAGVPSAEHKAWTTSLAIAATALREARLNGQLKHSVILQAVEFVQRLHQRLEVAVEGDRSALGLREQHVALRLLDEVSHVAGNAVGQFGALRLIRRGLEAVTKVLLNGESVQVGKLCVCVHACVAWVPCSMCITIKAFHATCYEPRRPFPDVRNADCCVLSLACARSALWLPSVRRSMSWPCRCPLANQSLVLDARLHWVRHCPVLRAGLRSRCL